MSRKFKGFVAESSYGKNFLQNYEGFLIHCGMTAMGNPGSGDTQLHHGELPVTRFDEDWIEMRQEDGRKTLSLRIRNSSPNPHGHNTPCTHSRQVPLSAIPNQQLTPGQRPLLFGVRGDLIRVTIARAP